MTGNINELFEDTKQKVRRNLLVISIISILYCLKIIELTGQSSFVGLTINADKKGFLIYLLLIMQIYITWRYCIFMDWKTPFSTYSTDIKNSLADYIYNNASKNLSKKIQDDYYQRTKSIKYTAVTPMFRSGAATKDGLVRSLKPQKFESYTLTYNELNETKEFNYVQGKALISFYVLKGAVSTTIKNIHFSETLMPLFLSLYAIICIIIHIAVTAPVPDHALPGDQASASHQAQDIARFQFHPQHGSALPASIEPHQERH